MTETWRGIYPITSFVLEALGRKRDAGPAGALTGREQVLLIAVEFWAAAAHGTLHKHLQPEPQTRLLEAQLAFWCDRRGAGREPAARRGGRAG